MNGKFKPVPCGETRLAVLSVVLRRWFDKSMRVRSPTFREVVNDLRKARAHFDLPLLIPLLDSPRMKTKKQAGFFKSIKPFWHNLPYDNSLYKPIYFETANNGVDVGIKHFLTDSDGRQIENPKFYGRTLERISVIQHWLSRKKKGSKNHEKQRVKLAGIYERLTNQRDDFLHKLSRFYVNNYDVICAEDLNVKGMIRNPA